MSKGPLELAAETVQQWPLFKQLEPFQGLTYEGPVTSKWIAFKGVRGEKTCFIFLASMIANEESLLWKSCQEMLEHAIQTAAQGMKGFFGYELLTADLSQGLKNFNPVHFSQLLINHAQKMDVGRTRLIPCGPFWGVLTKRVAETWGKVDFISHVEVFHKIPGQLDLYLKKLARDCMAFKPSEADERIIVVWDLGEHSFYRPDDPMQADRLKKLFCSNAGLPFFYIVHRKNIFALNRVA